MKENTVLYRMLTSMKLWTLLLGLVLTPFGAWLAKHGFDLSDKNVVKVAEFMVLGFSLLLGVQGLTDLGKEKAKVEAAKDLAYLNAPTKEGAEDLLDQKGFFKLDLACAVLFATFICVGATMTACSWLKSETKETVGNIVDCATKRSQEAVLEFLPMAEQVIVDSMDPQGKPDASRLADVTKNLKAELGGCVMQAAVDKLLKLATQAASGVMSSSVVIDADALDATWAKIRADRYGGKVFK